MSMTRTALDSLLRSQRTESVREILTANGDEVLQVGPNELAIPCLDAEDNETWITVKIAVPRGTRNGAGGYDEYDGYEAARIYAEEVAEKAEKKKAADAKKAAKIAADEKKRAEKAAKAAAKAEEKA